MILLLLFASQESCLEVVYLSVNLVLLHVNRSCGQSYPILYENLLALSSVLFSNVFAKVVSLNRALIIE